MPLGQPQWGGPRCRVKATGHPFCKGRPEILGKVIDGLGNPILDNIEGELQGLLVDNSPNPWRKPINQVMVTRRKGYRYPLNLRARSAYRYFLRQRRVGKSTLMGMIARYSEADVSVIALVGERGREVRIF